MDIYKLYASIGSDTDAAASLDIQVDGHIVAMSLEVDVIAADALNDGASAEVSFASTNGLASNDTKASIIRTSCQQGFLTTGGGPTRGYNAISGVAIEVAAGERVFLHADITGTCTCLCIAYLYVMPLANGSARALARRR